MGRTTKTMSGGGQTKYFRDLFRADGDVPEAAVERLSAQFEARIAQIRVRSVPLEIKTKAAKPAGAKPDVVTVTTPKASTAAFDPFSFSVVAMLAKKGRLVLEAKLSEISDAGQLRTIADAQHLGIDAAVTDAGALRIAMIEGAERRIADRRAAAS
jgi:hypothetical protein